MTCNQSFTAQGQTTIHTYIYASVYLKSATVTKKKTSANTERTFKFYIIISLNMNHWPSCCEACKRCYHFSFLFYFNWCVGRSLGDSVWHPQQCVGFTGSLCRAVISCAVFLHLCKLPPVINNPQETVVTSVSSHTYPPTRRCRCYSVKEEEDLTGDVIVVFTLGLSGVSTFVSSCSGQSSSSGP